MTFNAQSAALPLSSRVQLRASPVRTARAAV